MAPLNNMVASILLIAATSASLFDTSSAYLKFVGENIDASIDSSWVGSNPLKSIPSLIKIGEANDDTASAFLPSGTTLNVGSRIVLRGAETRIILKLPTSAGGETRIKFTMPNNVPSTATESVFSAGNKQKGSNSDMDVTCSNNYFDVTNETIATDLAANQTSCENQGLKSVVFPVGSTYFASGLSDATGDPTVDFASLSVTCVDGNCSTVIPSDSRTTVVLSSPIVGCYSDVCATGTVGTTPSTDDGPATISAGVIVAIIIGVIVFVIVGYLVKTRKFECSKREPVREIVSYENPLYAEEQPTNANATSTTPDADQVPHAVESGSYLDVEGMEA